MPVEKVGAFMDVPDVSVVKFNVKDKPEFFKELRKRVNKHFKEKNISKYANLNMKIKTAFMLCLYFIPLLVILTSPLTGLSDSLLTINGMWFLMSLGMSGIGLSIMHDANHGSYSKNQRVNNVLANVLNFVGGYPANWRIQHNVLHHSFTNIEGFDEDIDKKGVLRLSPNQPERPIYKYQVYYAPILYGLMTIYWLIGKDFEQIVKYNRKNLLAGQGLTFKKALREVIFHKTWYWLATFVTPMIILDIAWWQILLGFLMMHFISGLILALVFQPAHVIMETEFFEVDESGSVENNWAIHQMLTTANFANNSRVFSWLIGGINYQIEHHLFPNICHVHYRDISGIVKETAKEFNLPYHHHKTFLTALISHFTMLNKLGKGTK